MATTVFISHAGADWPAVVEIASRLRDAQVEVRADRAELAQGDSVLAFMERALRECDYFLLLWSVAASKSRWVQVEWEAALHRAVENAQAFLLVGRLEDHPVPELLRPRLRVDLFPDPAPGVRKLTETWQSDRRISMENVHSLVSPKCSVVEGVPGAKTVYVSSTSFGKTFPFPVALHVPTAVVTERIVSTLGLPRQLDHDGKMGVRFTYGLVHNNQTLLPDESLGSQGVAENDLVWLQTTLEPFSSMEPVTGALHRATFRGQSSIEERAQQTLLLRVAELGLGH